MAQLALRWQDMGGWKESMDSTNTINSFTFLRNPAKVRNLDNKNYFLKIGQNSEMLGSAGFMLFSTYKQYVTSLTYVFYCW